MTLMSMVEDGIISGWVETNKQTCGFCLVGTKCIGINDVKLPEGIDLDRTIVMRIMTNQKHPNRFIGIGCGCYAKFHRQVAHIQSKMESRKNAKRRKLRDVQRG
jgi:hypothetical protein